MEIKVWDGGKSIVVGPVWGLNPRVTVSRGVMGVSDWGSKGSVIKGDAVVRQNGDGDVFLKNSDSAQLLLGPSHFNYQNLIRILLARSTFRSLPFKFEWK